MVMSIEKDGRQLPSQCMGILIHLAAAVNLMALRASAAQWILALSVWGRHKRWQVSDSSEQSTDRECSVKPIRSPLARKSQRPCEHFAQQLTTVLDMCGQQPSPVRDSRTQGRRTASRVFI